MHTQQAELCDLEPRGISEFVPEVFLDGSYVVEAPGIGFAGYGVWFGHMDV